MKIVDVNPYTVLKTGFFCKISQKKCEGYQQKLKWLEARFAEGLRMKMLSLAEGGRGFIEYIPGEYAWRPVEASGYMFIHCLWVVGQSKRKGYASMLLEECLADAQRQRMNGVAMITSEGNWLVGKRFLFGEGFESVDSAPPTFELLVNKFNRAPLPSFPKDWDARMRRYGEGLTVIRTDQCPYIDEATGLAMEAAEEFGLKTRLVELRSCKDVREKAPTPYGVFSIVLNGKLLSYHYLTKKELYSRLEEALRNEKWIRQQKRKARPAAASSGKS
jgi:ribosomal protein S18 acetylase RimI-like enzyme